MDKELADVIKQFSKIKDLAPSSNEAKACVERLYNYFNTKCIYDLELFSGYIELFRRTDFKNTIDIIGDKGTSDFIANAIEYYCYN